MHAPFCTRQCAYCDFATATYHEGRADRYLDRLEAEFDAVIPDPIEVETVYVGGGTPTSFSQDQLKRLLSLIHRHLSALPREWTCEANPESLSSEHLDLLLAHDVDRLSLGNQSFQPTVLKALGRDHVPSHTDRALELLHRSGVRNFSVDLMFAAPGCDRGHLEADLAALAGRDVPHVSAYCLSYEAGTPLTRRLERGTVTRHLPEEELAQYRLVVEGLRQQGLQRYEISNFARDGFESRHNRIYWEGAEYHGLGLGAGSYVDGVRRTNTRDLEEYLGAWPTERPPHEAERLGPRERAREQVVLSLRMAEGLAESQLRSEAGFSLDELYDEALLDRLVGAGVLERDSAGIRLTERGFELGDSVFVELV